MYPKLRIYIYHLTLFTDSSVAEKYSNVSTVCVCTSYVVLTCTSSFLNFYFLFVDLHYMFEGH